MLFPLTDSSTVLTDYKGRIISIVSKLLAALTIKNDHLYEYLYYSSTTFELKETVLHVGVWGGISVYTFYSAAKIGFGILLQEEEREGQKVM